MVAQGRDCECLCNEDFDSNLLQVSAFILSFLKHFCVLPPLVALTLF